MKVSMALGFPCFIVLLAAALPAAAQSARSTGDELDLAAPGYGGEQGSSASKQRSWQEWLDMDVTATTLVPLSIGPELGLELPGRILTRFHVGWMPELYSNTITDALEDGGVYDDDVGALVDGSFGGATSWRLAAGWRPFSESGFEVTLGYVHVSLDGSTTTPEVMRLVPADIAEELDMLVGDTGLELESTIQHFTINAGWRWLIADRVVIGASIGYLQAFESSSSLRIESSDRLSRLTSPIVAAELHRHYMRYIKIPVVGLGIGYRFF